MADMQSRHYMLTINNPTEHGYPTSDYVIEVCKSFKAFKYVMFQLECGVEETPHYQLYICFNSAVRFTSMKTKFPTAHIERVIGTKQQAIGYCCKEDTRIDGPWEYGDDPTAQGKRVDLDKLVDLIKDGKSNLEIFEENTSYIRYIPQIDRLREDYRGEAYKNVWRDLNVQYIYGSTGTGKTRGIMELYGYSNVYRVTDYKNPFDNYKGEDVILFDEFRSSLKITDMLCYLDGYPLQLPCRYNNKYACFHTVYVVSNVPFSEQYVNVQIHERETFKAFSRRFNRGIVSYDSLVTTPVAEFMSVPDTVTFDNLENNTLDFV